MHKLTGSVVHPDEIIVTANHVGLSCRIEMHALNRKEEFKLH